MTADNSGRLSRDEADLRVWMSEWYDHALTIGFIWPPFILDDATALRLEGYFDIGLTPAEDVIVISGVVH